MFTVVVYGCSCSGGAGGAGGMGAGGCNLCEMFADCKPRTRFCFFTRAELNNVNFVKTYEICHLSILIPSSIISQQRTAIMEV